VVIVLYFLSDSYWYDYVSNIIKEVPSGKFVCVVSTAQAIDLLSSNNQRTSCDPLIGTRYFGCKCPV